MFARVESFHVEPNELDDLIGAQHHTVGLVRTMDGNMGGYVLVDREAGRVMNVTFWQSEEAREASQSALLLRRLPFFRALKKCAFIHWRIGSRLCADQGNGPRISGGHPGARRFS